MTDRRDQRLREALAEIRCDIGDGKTDEAVDKLGGLVLKIRPGTPHSEEIGNLFWEIGLPAMAGRYWYLLDNKSDEILAACDEFQRSLGNNPVLIIDALGWAENRETNIEIKLEELHDRARDFRHKYAWEWKVSPRKARARDRIALLGCGIVATILFFIFVAGILSIIELFRK
jgi:hypothetical protein